MRPKELAQRWFHEIWNQKNTTTIYEILDREGVGHTEGGVFVGPDQFEHQMFRPLITAFPDLSVTIEDCLEDGDQVVVRWKVDATQAGELLGVAATGRRLSFAGMTWLRFANGKLVEGWDRWNIGGLMALVTGGQPSETVRLTE